MTCSPEIVTPQYRTISGILNSIHKFEIITAFWFLLNLDCYPEVNSGQDL